MGSSTRGARGAAGSAAAAVLQPLGPLEPPGSATGEATGAPRCQPCSLIPTARTGPPTLTAGGAPAAVVGHSLGGKVALALLQESEGQLPQQVWVLDSDPGAMPVNADKDVDKVLQEVQAIPLPVPSRAWLQQHMAARGYSVGLTQWLGSNLVPAPGGSGFVWAFQLPGAAAMYNSYRVSDYWRLLHAPPRGVAINVVVAERSDRFTPAMMERLQQAQHDAKAADGGRLSAHVLPNAGHWLHVDNPGGLHDLMLPSFASPERNSGQATDE